MTNKDDDDFMDFGKVHPPDAMKMLSAVEKLYNDGEIDETEYRKRRKFIIYTEAGMNPDDFED